MLKVLLLLAVVAGGAVVLRKRASDQATATLWREATEQSATNASPS
ncbi:MAG TPA: DLW-39 family protein [Jatrophihabitantaceae bacterium]